jgi:hypothetical protein
MIEPTDADIGRAVLYTGNRFVGGKVERGEIRGFNHWTVFVRYGADAVAKATSREDLEWENMSAPREAVEAAAQALAAGSGEPDSADVRYEFMAKTALEAAVYMDGFAKGADMRFAAIEKRLKALEDAHEALQGRTGVGGVVSATPRQADIEQLPQDRDAEGGAVETGGKVFVPIGGGTAPQRDDG